MSSNCSAAVRGIWPNANLSFFTAEAHVCYVRELKPDARVSVQTRLMDFDAKRIHLFQELMHVDGWLSATCETLLLHIDMSGPRTTPMPDDVIAGVWSHGRGAPGPAKGRTRRTIDRYRAQTHRPDRMTHAA
jgi:acyl-CoA thioester hydrolase